MVHITAQLHENALIIKLFDNVSSELRV